MALYDFLLRVLYVPRYFAGSFPPLNFLQFLPRKSVTRSAVAKSNYRRARPNLNGDTMTKRPLHMLTNFASRFALFCGFGLASLLPLYAQQSTERAIESAEANTSSDQTTVRTAAHT